MNKQTMKDELYAEEMDHFLSLGESPYQTARALGVSAGTLERYMHRIGRTDLAAKLTPFSRPNRYGVAA